ncbi:hypothetical protein SAMN05421748_10499 [Paractinoplanes atraurantiacus]|uniref:Uncharacterized protein n=2 Tax=Paractinoplanes atraurantiacus TaxID=1036182 RepID=A0A285HBT8_9ACTN|nr:hypothetical protein SAMN05421748_10499 [Actinoplanes atraurantiacus]
MLRAANRAGVLRAANRAGVLRGANRAGVLRGANRAAVLRGANRAAVLRGANRAAVLRAANGAELARSAVPRRAGSALGAALLRAPTAGRACLRAGVRGLRVVVLHWSVCVPCRGLIFRARPRRR